MRWSGGAVERRRRESPEPLPFGFLGLDLAQYSPTKAARTRPVLVLNCRNPSHRSPFLSASRCQGYPSASGSSPIDVCLALTIIVDCCVSQCSERLLSPSSCSLHEVSTLGAMDTLPSSDHNLLLIRPKLTFDQLVGAIIQYGGEDQSTVQTDPGQLFWSLALCSNHVMRSDRHFALFTMLTRDFCNAGFGVVRPVQINEADFNDGDLDHFTPDLVRLQEYLIGQRTDRWTDSNVQGCNIYVGGNF